MSIKNLNKFIQLRDAILEARQEIPITRYKITHIKRNIKLHHSYHDYNFSELKISNWEDKISKHENRLVFLIKRLEYLKTVLEDMHPRIRMKRRRRRSSEEIEFCERSEPNDKKYKF